MTLNLPDTLITSEEAKMPTAVRDLLAEDRPLPPDAVFYEERLTTAVLMKRVAIAAVLFLIGVFLLFYSMEFLYLRHVDPRYREFINFKEFIASLVFFFAGWLMLSSIRTGWSLSRRQAKGERTRLGIFLLADTFVCHSQFDTTMIPRGSFRGLNGGTVNYLLNNAPKSFNLPVEWVGASPLDVHQAITAWSQAA